MQNSKIIDFFTENIGLIENIFGENTDKILLNTEREQAKRILIHTYGYNEEKVNMYFPTEIDEQKLYRTLETLFRFSNSNSNNNNNNNDVQGIIQR